MNVKKLLEDFGPAPLIVTMKNGESMHGMLVKDKIEGNFFTIFDDGANVETNIINMKDVSYIEEMGGYLHQAKQEDDEPGVYDLGKEFDIVVHDLRAFHMTEGDSKGIAGKKVIDATIKVLSK